MEDRVQREVQAYISKQHHLRSTYTCSGVFGGGKHRDVQYETVMKKHAKAEAVRQIF